MRTRVVTLLLIAILVTGAGLMLGAMRQESATVDETSYLGAGYCFFQTGSYRFAVGHPILSQLLPSFPLRFFRIHESPEMASLLQGKVLMPYSCRWSGPVGSTKELFPNGPDFYHWPPPESQYFGQYLVYDPANDAEGLLFWGRFTQVILTVALGLLVFFWARKLAGPQAGLIATTAWMANPVVLGYGHLILTDMSITLMLAVTVWLYAEFLQKPSTLRAVLVGVAVGLSFVMKFTALSLLPILGVITVMYWWRVKRTESARATAPWVKQLAIRLAMMVVAAWAVVMIVYFPNWSPAPPITPERAQALGVPGWFQALRPILLPRDYFKELAVMVGHVREGGDSYLMGQWSRTGWWYYYILAISFKSPIPLLLMFLGGLVLLLRKWPRQSFGELVPWLAAAAYLCFSMTSKVNIGLRHALPVYSMLAVAVGTQLAKTRQRWKIGVWVLCGWLSLTALFAYPFYIPYFNELVGGPKNGYKYLIDSNFDWGQDAKRLKQFLDERGIQRIYLDYFGTQAAIPYYQIPATRVNGEQARQIQQGDLVVSASQLVRPEWDWLRQSRQPKDCIAYTMFLYQFP
jgi:4-amino-4-deoxy-L-arabinose transferase-like glycosyltransferase